MRPLAPGQPWGVFFVKFQPKRLPVVALRRILSQVAIKARPSAHAGERQSWAPDDLLFVSNYGEGDQRRIAFAHFSKPAAARDLPTLKVLGWDNLDTALHLDDVARKLTEHLAWPDDENDAEAWREQWRAAFRLRHREVVTTSKVLSARLAELARAIRDRAHSALDIESESGPLTRLMKAFRTALLDDLDEAGFADMYAQTITYGLLSARIADPGRGTAEGLTAHMRTNPFLGDLMKAFFRAGGDPGQDVVAIDFDELGTSEVVELLDDANMEAVVRDFGDRNPEEDPVIHFYEHFLAAYDKNQKVSRGVFYTPRPVVSYIVRSVDELLRGEFELDDGLADTTTWGEMAARREGVEIPDGTSPDQPFVQILDPTAGTGTFLVEVIGLIHRTMVGKWKGQGHGERRIAARWNEYVVASRVRHFDLWGDRTRKYGRLLGDGRGGALGGGAEVEPRPGFFLLKPFAGDDTAEYDEWASVTEVLPVKSVGIVTARDALTVRRSKREIWGVVREVAEGDEESVRAKYRLRDVKDWKVGWAQRDLRESGPSEAKVAPILYRPFDTRYTYYTGVSRGFLCRPRADVMGHMLAGRNVGMCVGRAGQVIGADDWDIVVACSAPVDFNLFRRGGNCLFPLYLYPGVGTRTGELLFIPWPKGKDGRRPNLDPVFVDRLARASDLRFVSDGRGDLHATFGPEDLLAYIYAVFHSPGYRDRYGEHLKLDFPRVPLPGRAKLGRELMKAGHELLSLHLLESGDLDYPNTDYAGPRAPMVGRVGWSNGTVWLDAATTNARQRHRATTPGRYGFHGVREDVWDFQTGGYQVCHKWLKDRKGRTLSDDDIAHYQKIVVAVGETTVIMSAIDGVIEHFGGWPGAFGGEREAAGKRAGLAVAESGSAYEGREPGGSTSGSS